MILLDTTVLTYAVGSPHPLQRSCYRLLEAIAARRVRASTTPEVIQEFVHVRSRRRARHEAADRGREWMYLLAPLPGVDERRLATGLDLYRSVPGIGSFDAVLAATALTVGAQALVSADRGFGAVPDLRHVVPDDDGVGRLLGG